MLSEKAARAAAARGFEYRLTEGAIPLRGAADAGG